MIKTKLYNTNEEFATDIQRLISSRVFRHIINNAKGPSTLAFVIIITQQVEQDVHETTNRLYNLYP